ncbi:trimethylamine-N-oxide reductase TorA [Campylobacter sp. MIT 99-7217]|uniref:molybdopterin guanine dinucleotide-containing S/N-oxide reductase n=1 Tax=Campylobacter sp. MIT 99-7217 TaxID=535091 RepID=UPI0011572257|nr:molybdopterin guanine dinucleotide-containing S/N-oxide reductase [Campylobacter sp. MIT 99-7217]TQR30937.1 trimethylamine-N-oxide reductase TorA [Campylobacter sp. MIT 99-7217]
MSIDRRKFLKIGAAGVGALSLAPNLLANGVEASKVSLGLVQNGTIVTAAHWGVLKLTIKNGKVVKSEPYEKLTKMDNPLWYQTPDMIYKSRVRFPYVRKSYLENPDKPKPELRGKEEFVRVSYEDAIKLIAKELAKTRRQKGSSGVFAGSYGWKSSGNMQNSRILLHRFMNVTGGYVGVSGDYSTGASQVIMPYVVGSIEVYEQQTSWENILSDSKIVVIWGADPLSTLRISWTANEQKALAYFEKLRSSKIKVVCIDPIRTETAKFLKAEWIAPRPNTDVALMMGMASHLIATNKVNYEFLQNYTTGFEQFKAYLEGKEDKIVKDVKWASAICGIDEKVIMALAERFYDNPTMIMSGWAMQRAHHGEQPHWMLVTLCSMLGQIGTKGGGFGLSYHYSGGGVPTCKGGIIGGMSAGPVGIWKNGKFVGMPKAGAKLGGAEWLQNTASHSFPLARIADALLNPGKKIDHNGSKITYPNIDFIYWVGGNPLVHHQDTNTNKKAWRKPRTVVVNEIYWTPTAKMADIVMPVTSSYERDDITMAGDYSNMQIVPMKQAVAPLDESKDDYEIFSDLCKVYGEAVYNAYTENGKTAKDFIKEYYDSALKQTQAFGEAFATPMPSFEEFWAKNEPVSFEAPADSLEWVRFADFIEDPILNALGTESGLIEIYSKTIEKYKYNDCKAHPTWFEPIEWLGNANTEAPFHLITSHPANRLHSQLCHTSLREKYAVKGREPILINKKDAKKIGVKNGDVVRVFNKRGEILAGVVTSDDIMQGVVRICEGGWVDQDENGLCKYGGVNVLTLDLPTSKLANGNIAHTGLVNIEKFTGTLPEITAFLAPKGAL